MRIMTITGIRPDFIRMSKIFKKFDENFEHILVHTGQHYNEMLSDVFFKELEIRKPDYNLEIGGPGIEHHYQAAELSVKIVELARNPRIKPDLIVFLGDSNSVTCAVPLKKEGFKIAHIEAGMRSYDRRMLEEINRVVCDHCSDYLFVYHENYREKALREGIPGENIYVVGNTIVEVARELIPEIFKNPKLHNQIILDIHRPENFKDENRLSNIIIWANLLGDMYKLPVKMLHFGRTIEYMKNFGLNQGNIEIIPLMSYKEYIQAVYDSHFIISDSGTAQEEPCLFDTPVLVPRDYTERPESVRNNCSLMIDANHIPNDIDSVTSYIKSLNLMKPKIEWLGDGTTSQQITDAIKYIFK